MFNGFYNLFSVNYLIFIDIIGLTVAVGSDFTASGTQ